MKRKRTECNKCNKEISDSNFNRHIESCKGIIEKKETQINNDWLLENGKYKCPHCSKEYSKYGIGTHIWRSHTNHGKDFYTNRSGTSWNKGLNKGTDDRVKSYSTTLSNKYNNGELKVQPVKDRKQWKENLSLAASKNHNGGYKSVPYINYTLKDGKIIKLRGSFEIRFAKFLDKNNIDWCYQNSVSYIDKEGIKKHCLPDFYIPSLNKYIDPKGVLTNEFAEKIQLIKEQKGIIIHLVYRKDLEKIERGELKLEDI